MGYPKDSSKHTITSKQPNKWTNEMLGSSKLPNDFDFAKVRTYYGCPEKQKLDEDTRLQKLEFLVLSLSRELGVQKESIELIKTLEEKVSTQDQEIKNHKSKIQTQDQEIKSQKSKIQTLDQEIKSQKSLIQAQAQETIQQKIKNFQLEVEIEQKQPKITNSSISILEEKIFQCESKNSAQDREIGQKANITPVLFSYYEDSGTINSNEIITFSKSLVNIGDAFDGTTFTCSIPGIYEFEFTGTGYLVDNYYNQITVLKNDAMELQFWDDTAWEGYPNNDNALMSFQFMIKLNTGDKLKLRSDVERIIRASNAYSIFSGKFVRPL